MELLTLATQAVRENRKADELAAVLDGIKESMVKGVLLTRVVGEAMHLPQAAEQQAASGDVTLH